jgi:hypothetical protein
MKMENEFDMGAAVDTLSGSLFPASEAEPLVPAEVQAITEPQESQEVEEVESTEPVEPVEPVEPIDPNAPPVEPAEPVTDPTAIAPKTWRKEAAAEWANLSPTIKAEIVKREEDMFKGIENYKLDATIGNNFKNVVAPHIDYLQRSGVDPYAEVNGLLEYSKTMRFGTNGERMQLLGKIAHEYGIDLLDLAANVPPPAYVDPAVKSLQDQLNALQSTRQQEDTQRQQFVMQEAQSKINAFQANPKNEHFAAVEAEMAAFISSGVCKTLEEAYEKAVWANPLTRAKEQSRLAAEAQAQSQAKVAEAKKATAANVKTSARPGSATAPTGSIDDTLAETLAAIRSR